MIQWCDSWASLNHLKPFPKGTWMMLKVGTLLQHQKWAVGNKDCVRLGMWMVGRAAIVPTSFGSVHAQLNQWTWWSRVLAIICIRAPLNMGSPQIQCGVSSFSQLKIWSVVDLPLWKIWKSVGMIIPDIYGKIKVMFETTNFKFIFSWYTSLSEWTGTWIFLLGMDFLGSEN